MIAEKPKTAVAIAGDVAIIKGSKHSPFMGDFLGWLTYMVPYFGKVNYSAKMAYE